jgi:hypothetical protein
VIVGLVPPPAQIIESVVHLPQVRVYGVGKVAPDEGVDAFPWRERKAPAVEYSAPFVEEGVVGATRRRAPVRLGWVGE